MTVTQLRTLSTRPSIRSLMVGVALSLVALSSVAGSVQGNDPASAGPTFEQRQAFLLEEHGYSTDQIVVATPTFAQRQAFLLDEHGYATPMIALGLK